MKHISKWILALIVTMSLTMPACVSKTEFGKCVGAWQDDRREPDLIYDLSGWNMFWGVVGVEMILPPILVLHHETFCPTGKKVVSTK